MFKKYLLILILLIPSSYATTLELNYTSLGPGQSFIGLITLPPGDYNPDALIKLSTQDSSDSKKLKDVIDCKEFNCKGVIDYYKSTGEAQSIIQGEDILTGIYLPKDLSLISNAKFDIECFNLLDCPDTPSIDVGNDNQIEWIYPGQALTTYSLDYSGPSRPENIESDKDVIYSSSNCQKLLLKKSMQYKIRAYIRQDYTSDLNVFISGVASKESSCDQPKQTWDWVECTLNLTKPIETNYYYVCLRSTGSGNLLASNSTALYPQAYYGCPTNCQPVPNKDYIIQAKGADYITQLTGKETYNLSSSGEYFAQTLTNFYQNCNFYENYCTIPIRVASQNNKTIKLSNLEYKIQQGQLPPTIKNTFLTPSSITKISGQDMIASEETIIIPLLLFNVKTPKILTGYELKLEFNNEIKKINYNVVNLPQPVINISKEKAAVLETISLDSSSTSYSEKENLRFEWDLGDNTTKQGSLITYSYPKQGIYTITLTAVDKVKNITSLPVQKTIEISSSEDEISSLIESTLYKIERGISYQNAASQKTAQVYTDLNLEEILAQKKLTLTGYQSRIPSLQESQLQSIIRDVNEIISTTPFTIHVTETINIVPYLSYEDVNKIYKDKTTDFKETLQELNSRINQRLEAKLIHEIYLSDKIEDYILIKRIITPQNSLKDISVIEFIPKTLAPSQSFYFFNLNPEVTSSGTYLQVKYTFSNLDSSTPNVILYKIPSTSIDLVKDIKSVILPVNLQEKDIPFECGNAICNPAEDYLSCPEDCTCGNKICESNEDKQNCPQDCKKLSFSFILILLILVIIGSFGYYSYKNPYFAKKLKLDSLINRFNNLRLPKTRKIFKSEAELNRIVHFIKTAKEKGVSIERIKIALADKGWSQTQINYAVGKAK